MSRSRMVPLMLLLLLPAAAIAAEPGRALGPGPLPAAVSSSHDLRHPLRNIAAPASSVAAAATGLPAQADRAPGKPETPAPGPAAPPAQLQGRWCLVEQIYGSGKRNMVEEEDEGRVCLELTPAAGQITGRTWRDDDDSRKVDWPAWIVDGRTVPATVSRRELHGAGDGVTLEYEVRPDPDNALILQIMESYRLQKDGSLSGSMVVTLTTDGKEQGAYVLHRRFEKEP